MKQIIVTGRKILHILLLCISTFALGNEQLELNTKKVDSELVTQEESTVLEHVLEHMLMRIAENNQEPKENLIRLYQAVTERTQISIEDLNALLPEMIESMKEEQLRATRPDSPGIGNGAISGCCGCCDISQILAMLASIQARLVIINNLIIECCDEIQFDFQATWSILANLNVTATVDLSPVFSVITNCCNGTFSAIANLTLTATTDLSGVFSALNACCNSTFSMLDRIDREVVGTFSLLNRIIIDDQGTFSAIAACCNATFSVLANLTLTATVDLSGIFTALTACCNSTFSMLDRIDREVVGTFSLLNRIILDDQGTFSAIAACCNSTFSAIANLTVTSTTDLSGVFSALNACCNSTFSVLANLTLTATADLSGIFTALNACCNSTFSMLDRIDGEVVGTFSLLNRIIIDDQGTFSAIAACCNATFSVLASLTSSSTTDISGIFTALAACCDGTFSAIADLRNSLTCMATPITTPTNITASGPYCLQNDIIGTITVSADNVSINMNSHRILNGGIEVSGVQNTNVYDGIIDAGNGALISSSTAVTFDNIEIVNVAGPAGVAINVVNSNDVLFDKGTFHALTGQIFVNTATGVRFVNSDIFDNIVTGTVINIFGTGGQQITACRIYNNTSQNTVGLASSSNTIIQDTNFHDNAITGSMIASGGNNNTALINNCIFYNNRSTDGFIGIGFASTDGDMAVQNCDINGNRAASVIFAGIYNSAVLSTIRNNLIRNNTLTGGTALSISDHTNPFTATIISNQADNGSATNYDISPGAILIASLTKTTATLTTPATSFHNLLLLP